MSSWIPFKDGEYIVERAGLLGPDKNAVLLEEPVLSVFRDRRGRPRMEGHGKVRNILVVELLDEDDRIDLALDLGERFKFIMRDPILKSGKVFSPDVQSMLYFNPREPWEQIAEGQFESMWSELKFLSIK